MAVPRGDVVETTGDDLRGVLEAEAGGFATFDDDPYRIRRRCGSLVLFESPGSKTCPKDA